MKHPRMRITLLFLLGMLVLGGTAALYSPVLAAPCAIIPPATSCVDSVIPSLVANTESRILTVRGSDFTVVGDSKPLVLLADYGVLETTFVNGTTLTAVLPAGVPGAVNGRHYLVKVINGDGVESDENLAELTVMVPANEVEATPTITQTPEPTAFVRPLVVVQSYGPSSTAPIRPGQTFDVEVNLLNTGQIAATNVVITFFPGDFEPRGTGGIRPVGTLEPGQMAKVIQTFTAKTDLSTGIGLLDAEVRYNDVYGSAYTDKARLALDVLAPTQSSGGVSPTATPTPTPGPVNRPQFVINSYQTNVEVLKPGTTFTLQLDVRNMGTANARAVSMIVGGGSASSGGGGGTQEPGGVSGGSGEFTNFAPIGSSNVQFLGDVAQGASLQAAQTLIVNSTTQPGAYSLKISFVYSDASNGQFTDDQVITLLVLQPPRVDISFYRPPDPLFAGQPGMIPLQVVNLSNSSAVLGLMTVTAESAEIMNNTLLVGNVDPGFPITLDAQVIPMQPGPLELNIVIEYIDNFNQAQTITRTLSMEVMDAPPMGEGFPGMEGEGGGMEAPSAPETFWQKVWRFIRGLLGIGSGPLTPSTPGGGEGMPMPSEGEMMPGVAVPSGGMKGP